MINRNSGKAKEYVEDYRKQIKEKFQSNKRTKTELLATLSKEERMQGKEKEINDRYNADMRNFVHELKSDENFALYHEKYREDMIEIRKVLGIYADYAYKGQPEGLSEFSRQSFSKAKKVTRESLMISKLFPKAKKAASAWCSEWDNFLENMYNDIGKLSKTQRENISSSVSTMLSSPENIAKTLKGIKNTNTFDRFNYIPLTLFVIGLTGLGIAMLDNEASYLIVKLLGASWFVHGVKRIGEIAKVASIDGDENEIRNQLRAHKFDHGV